MPTLQDIKEITFPAKPSDEASLFVYEHKSHVPFNIERVFVISAEQACDRGAHAHKKCNQLLVCLNGQVELTIKDGKNEKNIMMSNPAKGILVPAGLWAEQSYGNDSILMVLTDQPYDESDYIRGYNDYLKHVGAA